MTLRSADRLDQALRPLYRSRDDGETWERADAGLPRDTRANIEALTLAAHAGGVSAFIGTTDGEVFAREDLCGSWTRIATGLPPISKRGHDGLLKVVSSVLGWFRPVFAASAAVMNGLTSRVSRVVRGMAEPPQRRLHGAAGKEFGQPASWPRRRDKPRFGATLQEALMANSLRKHGQAGSPASGCRASLRRGARTRRWTTRLALACVAAATALPAACTSSNGTTPGPDAGAPDGAGGGSTGAGGSSAAVARGEYLVRHLLYCSDCHTTPTAMGIPSTDPADFLAGGRDFQLPLEGGVGHVYSANLTPDMATGLGSWSIDQIKRAILHGIDNQGMPLYPIMPYAMFGNLTDADVTAIALFLKSLPAKAHQVPNDTVSVPAAAPTYADSQIPHTTLPQSDPGFASAERGRYLVKVSCVYCHTPDSSGGQDLDFSKVFAGGRQYDLGFFKSVSANLTPDPTGLGAFSTADIVATLKTGQEKGTGPKICPPMPAGADAFGGLTDADLADIAQLVHTLPPIAHTFPCPSPSCCPAGQADAGTD